MRHLQVELSNIESNLSESKLQQKNSYVGSLKQESFIIKQTTIPEATTISSSVLAYEIAKHNKHLSEAEFLNIVSLEVKAKTETMSLSRRAIICHIDAILQNL